MNREDRMPKAAEDKQSSSRTTTSYETGPSTSATPYISIGISIAKPGHQRNNKNVEAAVYSYIQALRALGKTQVNTAEIARALGLPVSIVDSVLPKLNEKGIRRAG
jgi:hypothetical protein